jgi:hypothetical protein
MAGVYAWIREGVRRAVLLGFSDAFEQIGMPDDRDRFHPALEGVLGQAAARPLSGSSFVKQGRKRLGKSLDQISQENSESP